MLHRLAALALAATAISTPARAGEDPSARTLLALASRYISTFVDRFSHVVAEERYVQDWKTSGGISLMHRESTADFLLSRVGDSNAWQAFRDVFEVNGTPIRDRQDRLTALFLLPSEGGVKQAAAISAESSRYNISNVQRSVNQPLFVLIFLQPANQPRFAYTVDKPDGKLGPDVWIVEYKETARPTLIRGTKDRDLPAKGRVWIDAASGRIVRTELQLEDNLQNAVITSTFQNDARFQIDVPTEMDEQYSVKGNAGRISAKATYGRFRQFEVRTQEDFKPEDARR